MRKEIVDLGKIITKNTSLEEIRNVVQTFEELNYLLEQLNLKENFVEQSELEEAEQTLTQEEKENALKVFARFKAEEIKIALVQRTLKIGFGKACLITTWLKNAKKDL